MNLQDSVIFRREVGKSDKLCRMYVDIFVFDPQHLD
jgi:hypothetical protein